MKKFLIIFAMMTIPTIASAGCSIMTSQPSSSYTLIQTIDSTTLGNYGSNSCSSTTTKYYLDTTNMVYAKVLYCTACASEFSLQKMTVQVGSCSWDTQLCSTCSITSTKPTTGSGSGLSQGMNCATYNTKYLYYSGGNIYHTIESCATCPSGWHIDHKNIQTVNFVDGCGTVFYSCTQCGTGYIYSKGQCVKCAAGEYSNGNDSTTCLTCPSKDEAWTSSALTTKPSVSSGSISSNSGHINKCFLKNGTYYDTQGAFTYGDDCYYDGTLAVDKCATVSYACLSYTGTANTAVSAKTNSSTGGACWCTANNKSIYMTTMGPDASPTYTSNCESSCLSACKSQFTYNTTWRTAVGCD